MIQRLLRGSIRNDLQGRFYERRVKRLSRRNGGKCLGRWNLENGVMTPPLIFKILRHFGQRKPE